MKCRAHIYVSGRVQGVNYRSFTLDTARSLGLRGWVRNLPDYRVEAVFEGDRDKIEKAVLKCKQGPPAAHVDDIAVTWEEKLEGFSDFRIRY